MPASSALCTTRRVAARSRRPPKLLPPRPIAETVRLERPSLRGSIAQPLRLSLRPWDPEDLPCLGRRGDVAAEALGEADHALDQHGIVLGELARRDIGVVLVADAHVSP